VIIVDTSVWVSALRDPDSAVTAALGSLVDSDAACLALPVRLELAAGLGRSNRAAVRRALTALPVVFPTEETWAIVERWIDTAADAGHRFAVVDLLIAALAHELTGLVWSLDSDFERMASLGFVRTYR
jgi:predicted nucleic acid-binding protein